MRRLVDADVDAAQVFADKPKQEHDHAADKEQRGKHAGVAHRNPGEHQFFIDDENARCKTDQGAKEPDKGGGTERLDRKSGKAVNPEADKPCNGVARFPFEATAVPYGNVAQVLGRTEDEPADISEGMGIAHNFIDDKLAHDEKARSAERLGLPDDRFGHFLVDPGAKTAKQVLCGMLVVPVNHIVAFFQLVDQLECVGSGRLPIVVEADDVIARSLPVARHQSTVLPEVFRKADTLDATVGGGKSLDDLPYIVRATVVDQDNFVIRIGTSRHGLADFLHHGLNGILAAIAGNDE